MVGLQEAPTRIRWLLVAAIVAYFVVWVMSMQTGSTLAIVGSEILFGLLAVGIGGALYAQTDGTTSVLSVGATLLVFGGVAQLVWIGSVLAGASLWLLNPVASIAIFAGIGCYIYVVWIQS